MSLSSCSATCEREWERHWVPKGLYSVASRGRRSVPLPAQVAVTISLSIEHRTMDGSLHLEATSASAAVPPPPSGVRGLEDVEQHGPALPLRLRPEPPAHLPGGFRGPFAAVLAAPRRRGKVELSRSLAFSRQRQQRAALRGDGGRLRRRRARRRRDRARRRRRCGAARRGRRRRMRRRRRSRCALLDDLLLSVDPPSPSPQLDHRSPARGLRENHLKWTTKQRARLLSHSLTHSLTSPLAFAHLAVENVLAEEALSLVPVRVPEHGVPFYPPVLELAVENISVLIPVGEGSKRNMETCHMMTRIIWPWLSLWPQRPPRGRGIVSNHFRLCGTVSTIFITE